MTRREKTLLIELACQEVNKCLPKPKPKTPNWNVHEVVARNRRKIMRLIKQASEKHGIDQQILINIYFK